MSERRWTRFAVHRPLRFRMNATSASAESVLRTLLFSNQPFRAMPTPYRINESPSRSCASGSMLTRTPRSFAMRSSARSCTATCSSASPASPRTSSSLIPRSRTTSSRARRGRCDPAKTATRNPVSSRNRVSCWRQASPSLRIFAIVPPKIFSSVPLSRPSCRNSSRSRL